MLVCAALRPCLDPSPSLWRRFAVWPRVRAFIESLPRGGVVADVGCGNGKYFGVRRDLAVLGSDFSAGEAAGEGWVRGKGWAIAGR